MTNDEYTVSSAFSSLTHTLHQYLRASYHIWDEGLIAERDRLLTEPGITFQSPYLEATPVYQTGDSYSELPITQAAKDLLSRLASDPRAGIPPRPYSHQAAALVLGSAAREDMVVATGTGSGKTESFLMPIIANLINEATDRKESWASRGMRALLLYPMNALVNDQLSRLRRLFASTVMVDAFQKANGRRPTFGMYTSRAPYPGARTPDKDKRQVVQMLQRLYVDNMTVELRDRLTAEGKWPAKDLEAFIAGKLKSSVSDSELITRHEMQGAPPDLLITNYSMLEYMMLRPIESRIFDSTAEWLQQDSNNKLTIVVDEAHMYRGSGGAEVAYLLRRLHARLKAPRDRFQYILTSASLGSSDDAREEIRKFAAKLTCGAAESTRLVSSSLVTRDAGRSALPDEARAFAAFEGRCLLPKHPVKDTLASLQRLASDLGIQVSPPNGTDLEQARDFAYRVLAAFPAARLAATVLSGEALTFTDLQKAIFPSEGDATEAAEALLALMAYGRDAGSGRPFCSIRSHMFFRGLPGLFACVNRKCAHRDPGNTNFPLLGRLFTAARLTCSCGARVYELLTHRSCGAAYLKAFARPDDGDFLWHEASTGVWSHAQLQEGQYFVVHDGNTTTGSGNASVWLHIYTGRLRPTAPDEKPDDYIEVIRPAQRTKERGRSVWSLAECPACKQSSRTDTPIAMDLVTKGEAPFAHLVRAQVAIQPRTAEPTVQSPNGGRKTLIFSDGRQKAARLARDIPREIELDVFRQAMFMAARELSNIRYTARLDRRLYAAFVKVAYDNNLMFFDGDDRRLMEGDIKEYATYCDADLQEAIDHFDQLRPAYSALLLKQLCSSNYSVAALTLGYVAPDTKAAKSLSQNLDGLTESEKSEVAVAWLQRLLFKHAFQANLPLGVRKKASPYPHQPTRATAVFSKSQKATLARRNLDADGTSAVLAGILGEEQNGGVYIDPKKVLLRSALEDTWTQCENCKNVAPLPLLGCCALCGAANPLAVDPASTTYLRARKGFWRDPVVAAVLAGETPLCIDVQEHSAQLSYKDEQAPTPTTEEYERRFRDILKKGERAVDVLSCTTTMEVGIDIGSLIAVSMRNVPPMRQNYQQRAGRAGRRGSAVSTVVTFAQSGAHDSFYFEHPARILSGDPPKPILDVSNGQIAERHVHAQLLQDYFKPIAVNTSSGAIDTALGDTWTFFHSHGPGTLADFEEWISSDSGGDSISRAQEWLPAHLNARVIDLPPVAVPPVTGRARG